LDLAIDLSRRDIRLWSAGISLAGYCAAKFYQACKLILFAVALFLVASFLAFLFRGHKQVETHPGVFSAGIGLTLQILLLDLWHN
jgi:hypothetical protein